MKNISRLRALDDGALASKLEGARNDLMKIRAQLASGGSIENPSQIKELKKEIARILTLQKERAAEA